MALANNITPGRMEGSVSPKKTFTDTKRWISGEFYQALNRHMTTPDGNSVTYMQQMVASVVDMATDPERDDYARLAATKFIVEHLEGKAQTMSDDRHEEMPKLVICVQGTSADQIRKAAKELEGTEPPEDVLVDVHDVDDTNHEEYIVS